MAFKILVILAVVASAYAVPVLLSHTSNHEIENELPVEYEFSYSVHDDHTGDIKSQKESRKGHDVKGEYSLIDADGFRRIVEYTSDEHNGFQATVKREPVEGFKAPEPAPASENQIKYVAPKIAKLITFTPAKLISHGHHTVSIDAHGVKTVY